jgi:hypothetical protein
VVVYDGRRAVFSNSEYSFAAKWVKERYGLCDNELIALYHSYKKDYNKKGEPNIK